MNMISSMQPVSHILILLSLPAAICKSLVHSPPSPWHEDTLCSSHADCGEAGDKSCRCDKMVYLTMDLERDEEDFSLPLPSDPYVKSCLNANRKAWQSDSLLKRGFNFNHPGCCIGNCQKAHEESVEGDKETTEYPFIKQWDNLGAQSNDVEVPLRDPNAFQYIDEPGYVVPKLHGGPSSGDAVGHVTWKKKVKKEFNSADTDGDGKLTKEEWLAKFGSLDGFKEADANGDGVVDEKEFLAAKAAKKEFMEADADGDGKVTKEEWLAHFGSLDGFKEADANGDGAVDLKEFMKAKAAKDGAGADDKYGDKTPEVDPEWYTTPLRQPPLDGPDAYNDNSGDGKNKLVAENEEYALDTQNISLTHKKGEGLKPEDEQDFDERRKADPIEDEIETRKADPIEDEPAVLDAADVKKENEKAVETAEPEESLLLSVLNPDPIEPEPVPPPTVDEQKKLLNEVDNGIVPFVQLPCPGVSSGYINPGRQPYVCDPTKDEKCKRWKDALQAGVDMKGVPGSTTGAVPPATVFQRYNLIESEGPKTYSSAWSDPYEGGCKRRALPSAEGWHTGPFSDGKAGETPPVAEDSVKAREQRAQSAQKSYLAGSSKKQPFLGQPKVQVVDSAPLYVNDLE